MTNPLVAKPLDSDGRQSEVARDIARGTGRCLSALGYACLAEVTLANGRRADLMAVAASGEVWIIEIKSSIEDFRSDQKWHEYREFCDRFFFAVQPTFPRDVLPPSAGLILADRYAGDVARPAEAHRMAASRRKVVITSFGRTAAQRLQSAIDPLYQRDQALG